MKQKILIDIEKFICSLMQFTPVSKEVKYLINCALKDQGLEYEKGKIVKIEQKQEPTEFIRGYKKAIEDAREWLAWYTGDREVTLDRFDDGMEQKLKELSQG